MNTNSKIGIVGLGLIGGSIFKALCKKGFDVSAVSKSAETIEKANNYFMEFTPHPTLSHKGRGKETISVELESLKDCDIVFVCTPMNKTLEILDKLESILSPDAIVTDTCSLKSFLCIKKRPYKFIPSHPMAGTEFSGFDNSFETLFEGAKWILTPFEETAEFDVKSLSEMIEQVGAKVILSNPKEHDEAVALISHMPMLISQALFKTAQGNDLALKLASSGFRDMTRLAMSNTEMAKDMIDLNADNVQNSLLKLYSSIGMLLGENYKPQIDEIKNSREKMYFEGKNTL